MELTQTGFEHDPKTKLFIFFTLCTAYDDAKHIEIESILFVVRRPRLQRLGTAAAVGGWSM
jgi:hypothetical protein